MIVIGIGSQSSATAADICAAIASAEIGAQVTGDILATLRRGAPDQAIADAAGQLDRTLILLDRAELVARGADCVTCSKASLAAHGIPSVAEASALAGAGAGSRLIAPRATQAGVTVAIAVSTDNYRISL